MTIDNWGMLFAFILGVGVIAGVVAGLTITGLERWDDYRYGDEDDDDPDPGRLPEHTNDADPGPPAGDGDPAWGPLKAGETEHDFLTRVAGFTPPPLTDATVSMPLGRHGELGGPVTIVGGADIPIDWPAEADTPLLELARDRGIGLPRYVAERPEDTPSRWVRTPRVLHLRGCTIARQRGEDVPADTVQAAVAYAADQHPPLRYCHLCSPAAELQTEEEAPWQAT